MRLDWRYGAAILALIGVLVVGWVWWSSASVAAGRWGIDACLTRHAGSFGRLFYGRLLAQSGVGILRERGVGAIAGSLEDPGIWRGDVRAQLRNLKGKGYRVVAIANLLFATRKPQAGNQLPEDLLHVYQQGRCLGREFAGLVDAWEMVGEPDIGYCTDLPDRVAAYQKALYLGIRHGATEAAQPSAKRQAPSATEAQVLGGNGSKNPFAHDPMLSATTAPVVLMGALGMPPGPWLERAAANGLLDYTDAYNFHFYGHAKDLTGVISAHREAISQLGVKSYALDASDTNSQEHITNREPQRRLPLWITECGIEAVAKDDWLNPQRRQLQADFTISTAKQALAADDVAVFMPFILVHDKDPYAMTLSATKTLPAWDAYAKFTRENPWPKRALSREPRAVSHVVLQWLPDNRTCVPHKVSGTYRFKDDEPIKGELRLYNFSDNVVTGRIKAEALKNASITSRGVNPLLQSISVPAMGMTAVPVTFSRKISGYFRETWTAAFETDGSDTQVSGSFASVSQSENRGQTPGCQQASTVRSQVSFGLEVWAESKDFIEEPLALQALPDGAIRFPQIPEIKPGEQIGVWTTMNGLRAEVEKPETGNLKPETHGPNIQVSGFNSQAPGTARSSSCGFWIDQKNTDPFAPTMAVAAVNGLPSTGFIRMLLDKPMTKHCKVLMVLVDDRGQRYTIWENFGADYYGSRSDIWLNLEDFHADFWGPCSSDYKFRAERIREVHLRFYLDNPHDPIGVRLNLLKLRLRS